ncbi:helix-turn-helix transcriptional regulator [Nocardia speluncae]|uniref:Helix-turn-helix transcriptional regulator n=1 Tax=Nocardia speluncae TaxID=419477 RepID=A0A846XLU2_9NOCA|nr:helix-turn-helix transcriptional regulator [Nocardia speluncae]
MLAVIELLGQRWILRVLWELEPGPLGFLELRRRMGNCSSSMLSNRLQQLHAAGLIEKHGSNGFYELTAAGIGLSEALQSLWDRSESWGWWWVGRRVDARQPEITRPSSIGRSWS